MSTAFRLLQEFDPMTCRMLAVRYPAGDDHHWPIALRDEEIMGASGLSLADVRHLSLLLSWDDVPVGRCQAFIKGCRINFGSFRALDRYRRLVNRRSFSHLKRSGLWAKYFNELHTLWMTHHIWTPNHNR